MELRDHERRTDELFNLTRSSQIAPRLRERNPLQLSYNSIIFLFPIIKGSPSTFQDVY